jgi:hypothetical protein
MVAVSILTTMHVINKSSAPVGVGFNAPAPVGLPVNVSLNMPMYVVGPRSLVWRLVGVGVPQSLIKLINLSQLPSLPGNSTILIGYSVIEPSVVVGVVNGEVKLNLTSPVIDLLTNLITKGDLIMLYGNTSDVPAMEYLLAYSWARRYGVLNLTRWGGPGKPSDYLIAYPEIPVGSKEALAVAFGGPRYLVIGPAMPRDVLRAVMMYIVLKHPSTSQAQVGVNLDPTQDPCWLIYSNYSKYSELEPGVYESNNNYFIWAAPLMNYISGAPYTEGQGIEGYSDGNGTFYYDTCLEIGNQVWATATPPNIPAYVYGFVGYKPTTTMVDNGGQVLMESGAIDYYYSYYEYQQNLYNSPFGSMLNSYSPPASSQESSYSIGISIGPEGPTMEFTYEISLPSGSETVSVTLSPMADGIDNIAEDNITWTFNLNNANTNTLYANAFEDTSPAYWILPNYSSGTEYETLLPVLMSAEVMTSSWSAFNWFCFGYLNTYEYVWVDGGWWLTAQPIGSSTGLVPSSTSWTYSISPSASQYVTGVSSWSACVQ